MEVWQKENVKCKEIKTFSELNERKIVWKNRSTHSAIIVWHFISFLFHIRILSFTLFCWMKFGFFNLRER